MKIMINFIQEQDETNQQVISMLQALFAVGLNLGRETVDNDLHLFQLNEFRYCGPHRFISDYETPSQQQHTFTEKVHVLSCPLCGAEVLITDHEYARGTIVTCKCELHFRYDAGFKWILVSL